MTLEQYIRSCGLTTKLVAQKAGVTRQALHKYGVDFTPTVRTLQKLSDAMTALGVEAKVVDLAQVLYGKTGE